MSSVGKKACVPLARGNRGRERKILLWPIQILNSLNSLFIVWPLYKNVEGPLQFQILSAKLGHWTIDMFAYFQHNSLALCYFEKSFIIVSYLSIRMTPERG